MKRKNDQHDGLPPFTPFSTQASIALIGLRSVGKSAIGLLASTALKRHLIDQNLYFKSKAGMTIVQFVSTYGWSSYCDKQTDILEEIFREHGTGAVVVCSSDCVERQKTKDLLREWCREHPVIHIIRPAEEVAQYLPKKYPKDRTALFLRLAAKREPIYSTCSNYEFYNWCDNHSPSLFLKKVEQHFLRLLNLIFQTDMSALVVRRYRPSISSMYNIGVESRTYTYALAVPDKANSLEDLDLEEIETAVETFELRVDNLITAGNIDFRRISHQFSYLRRNSMLPIIYHVSRQDNPDYLPLLTQAFRLGADYVVVDLELEESQLQVVKSKGSTKLIGSWCDENGGWDDNKRREMYDFANRLGCDFVKLTQEAKSMDDNLAAISFARDIRKESGPSLIAYNTGPIGKLSRIFNPILSPVAHPSMGRADELTPKEALRALHSCSVFPTLHFYIFGSVVAHSLSPSLHNAAFEAYGFPHKYRIYESSTVNGLQQLLLDANLGGVGVTVPYKQKVMPLLQTLSKDAKAIGAVNTIIPIRQEGKVLALHGENTDWIGIRSCVLRSLTALSAITSRSTALVCGAGEMARAAIYALQNVGVENVFLCNRTEHRAHELAKQFCNNQQSVHVLASPQSRWPEGYLLPSVIVSCIPPYPSQGSEMSDFFIPDEWLQNGTGGFCIEACQSKTTLILA